MDTEKTYKLSTKRPDTGKWWSYGSIKTNQYGRLQAGFKVTPELKALISANDGKWINFSLFEEEKKGEVTQEAQAGLDKLYDDSSDIPF